MARQAAGDPTPASAVRDREPAVKLIVDEPEGTMPDVRGMSAREAVRTLVRLGMIARLAGDGFVVAQDPPAGTPLEATGACRLVLERAPAPAHRSVDEGHH